MIKIINKALYSSAILIITAQADTVEIYDYDGTKTTKTSSAINTLSGASISDGNSILSRSFLGAGAGYLLDSEEPFYYAQLGLRLSDQGSTKHNIYLEYGTADTSTNAYKEEFKMLTVNYSFTKAVSDRNSVEYGAGVGAAQFDLDETGGSTYGDNVFAWQLFTNYYHKINTNTSAYIGAKFIARSDLNYGVNLKTGSDTDVIIQAGIRFKF